MPNKRYLTIDNNVHYNNLEDVFNDFISYKLSIGICGKIKKEYKKVLNNFLKISNNDLSINSLQHD